MTLAAVDRLVHHSTIFELSVESYCRRHASVGSATAKPKQYFASPAKIIDADRAKIVDANQG